LLLAVLLTVDAGWGIPQVCFRLLLTASSQLVRADLSSQDQLIYQVKQ